MSKEERQEQHQLRLKLKKEQEEKWRLWQSYYWKFIGEKEESLRKLPERSPDHPLAIALLHRPSFEDHLHCRVEWNQESAICTKRIWKHRQDAVHFTAMPQSPDDPRSFQDYWRNVKPTFEEEKAMLSVSQIAELIDLITNLQLSILPPISNWICVDGESFELIFMHGDAFSAWEWYNKPPKSWQELEQVVVAMKKLAGHNFVCPKNH